MTCDFKERLDIWKGILHTYNHDLFLSKNTTYTQGFYLIVLCFFVCNCFSIKWFTPLWRKLCFSRKESLPPPTLLLLSERVPTPLETEVTWTHNKNNLHYLIIEKMNLQIRRRVCKLEGEFANWFFVHCILFADIKLCIAFHLQI